MSSRTFFVAIFPPELYSGIRFSIKKCLKSIEPLEHMPLVGNLIESPKWVKNVEAYAYYFVHNFIEKFPGSFKKFTLFSTPNFCDWNPKGFCLQAYILTEYNSGVFETYIYVTTKKTLFL